MSEFAAFFIRDLEGCIETWWLQEIVISDWRQNGGFSHSINIVKSILNGEKRSSASSDNGNL